MKISFARIALCFLAIAVLPAAAKIPVILSTDIGNEIDDQWALTYMLVNPDFDVLGILSANAPSLPDPSAHYTYEILKDVVERRLGMSAHPPLFEGSSLPLTDARTPRPNDGVTFIINESKKFSSTNRLTVLAIGAATDVASALLIDPTLAMRIKIVAMAFNNPTDGREFNVQNDPNAWRAIFNTYNVPLVIGPGETCRRDLALTLDQAKELISAHGRVGAWLWEEYKSWYFRNVKPLRVNDFSKPWIIWDIITLAYLEGMTHDQMQPRAGLDANLALPPQDIGTTTWITSVDSKLLWADFLDKLDRYQRTHAIGSPDLPSRLD